MEMEPANRVEDELSNLQTDILSARCIVHRLRRRQAEDFLANMVSKQTLYQALLDLTEVVTFVRELQDRQEGLQQSS